ncbi:MAG: phospholipid carrier-dependent glycosyltransferase [Spartobacteria bacterium]|nr:phospholipid carrier-dependent glycosyltransferase [Spartobacteria bacterium]
MVSLFKYRRTFIFGLLLVFSLWGGWLRLTQLGYQSLWLDEGVSATITRAIIHHSGIPRLANESIQWNGYLFHLLNTAGAWLSDDLHVASRLFPAFCGILCIPALFFLVRSITASSTAALLSAFLLSISSYEIAWSRQGRFYSFLQLLLLLHLLFCHRYVMLHKKRDAVLCLLTAFAAVQTHRAGMITLLTMATACVLYDIPDTIRLFKTQHPKNAWIKLTVYILTGTVALFLLLKTQTGLAALKGITASGHINYLSSYATFYTPQFGLCTGIFVAVGLLALLIKQPRATLLVLLPALAYAYVVCFRTDLFAFRYLFPIYFIPFMALSAPLLLLPSWITRHPARHMVLWTGYSILLAFCFQSAQWRPESTVTLGYSAPQPDWKTAYELILERQEKMKARGMIAPDATFDTISALPMLEELYLGNQLREKFYLPVTHSGLPTDQQWNAPYSRATTLLSLDELLQKEGYLILDNFGLQMMLNEDIKTYLTRRKPNALVQGDTYNVYIWVLSPQQIP